MPIYSHVALPHRCSGVMLFLLMTSEELCQHAKLCPLSQTFPPHCYPSSVCVLHSTIMSKEVVMNLKLIDDNATVWTYVGVAWSLCYTSTPPTPYVPGVFLSHDKKIKIPTDGMREEKRWLFMFNFKCVVQPIFCVLKLSCGIISQKNI